MTGIVSLAENEVSVSETAGVATVAFRRAGDTSGAVTISYEVIGDGATAGSDFTPISGTVRIAAGARQATIDIPILDDDLSEETENVIVSVLAIDSGTLTAPRTTQVNILDDENPVVVEPEPPLVSDYIVTENPIATDLPQITDIAFHPEQDNLMFISVRSGSIRVFDLETNAFLPDFVDIADEVGGQGIMNIALHPDFPEQPYVYAYYAVDPPETEDATGLAGRDGTGNRFQWLARFEADPSTGFLTALPDSKVVLVGGAGQSLDDISGGGALDFGEGAIYADLPASDQINLSPDEIAAGLEYRQDYLKGDGQHIGGGMAFGPDGNLYVSTGDGVAFNYGDPRTFAVQDVNSLSGKVLRIDPLTGQGLTDNPFHEAGESLDLNKSKVFQYGLRNPFSIGFSRDGALIITDTGQSTYEEIDVGAPGANFGWPFYEGADGGSLFTPINFRPGAFPEEWAEFLASDPDVQTPLRAFHHRDAEPGFQFQAITGGDVDYDGPRYPDSLDGHYFFSDFSDGEVFVVDLENREDVRFLYSKEGGNAPVYFTQGPDGFVYYVDVVRREIGFLEIEEIDPGPQKIGAVVEVVDATHERQTVAYRDGVALENPVVFAAPVSLNFADPVTVEFTRIGSTDARFYLDEPDYKGGLHREETVSLLALEEGLWQVGGGRRLEVGTVDLDAGDPVQRVDFAGAFGSAPAVLAQIQSDGDDPEWVIARTYDINETGFTVRLQEEEANDGVHGATVVGFLAIEAGALSDQDVFFWNNLDVQAFRTGDTVDHDPSTIDLASRFNRDTIVAASLSSRNGLDTAGLRMSELPQGDFAFTAQEERSADREVDHREEAVNGLAFGGEGALTGTDLLLA